MIRILFVLFIVLLIHSCSTQQTYKPSITCYMKYDHEETISRPLSTVISYAYQQKEATHHMTTDGELCSKMGCACFSYRGVCSVSSPGKNHFSQCTDDDRQNGVIKWHRGWGSIEQCEQMRYYPQTFVDLTCCHTDRCNDQPGKVTKYVDTYLPIPLPQYHQPYVYQNPETTTTTTTTESTTTSTKPPRRYVSHVHHSTTTRSPETYKPSPANDKSFSLTTNSSSSQNFISYWMISFILAFPILIVV